MLKKHWKKYVSFTFLVVFLIAWTALVYFWGPDEIVQSIGVQNSYIGIVLIALLGGLSSFSSAGFYTALIALVLGGLNPFLLAFFTGTALAIGDSFIYYLGLKGKDVVSTTHPKLIQKVQKFLNKQPNWAVPVFTYLYMAFTPLPHDIITAPLGFSDYPYKKLIVSILLGNMTLILLISLLAQQGKFLFA